MTVDIKFNCPYAAKRKLGSASVGRRQVTRNSSAGAYRFSELLSRSCSLKPAETAKTISAKPPNNAMAVIRASHMSSPVPASIFAGSYEKVTARKARTNIVNLFNRMLLWQ